MRILTSFVLALCLISAAPVMVGMAVNADPAPLLRETVITKTSPDGTWPFEKKAPAIVTPSYWI